MESCNFSFHSISLQSQSMLQDFVDFVKVRLIMIFIVIISSFFDYITSGSNDEKRKQGY
jgi:hypothetical protein